MKDQITGLEKSNSSLRKENTRLQLEMNDLKGEMSKTRQKAESLEQLLRNIQLNGAQSRAMGAWASREDTQVKADFADLNDAIRHWAEKFAIVSLARLYELGVVEFQELGKLSDQVTNLFSEGHLNRVPGNQAYDILPAMLLTALTTDDIYHRIFQNPWYFMESSSSLKMGQKDDSFLRIFGVLKNCSLAPVSILILC